MADKVEVAKAPAKNNQSNILEFKGLDKKITFEFNAPQASKVNVAGGFNNWSANSFSLKKGKNGIWTGQLQLKPGRYEYRFLVDGRWENQPGVEYASNSFGSTNCILEVK